VPRIEVDLSEVEGEIEGLTQEYLVEVASKLVDRLKVQAPSATGSLQRNTQIWNSGPGKIVITMPSHAKYVQFETDPPAPGRSIPFDPIQKWSRRVLQDEDAAWAVWQKLMNEGTDADPFVDRAIEDTIREFQ